MHSTLSLQVGDKLSSPLLIFVQDMDDLYQCHKAGIGNPLQDIIENVYQCVRFLDFPPIILAKFLVPIRMMKLL